MHMTDVMTKLKEIAESGYDNEDIQRGIDAASKHQVEEDESVQEGTEMGQIGNVHIKQFGMGKGQVGIQLTSDKGEGYVQLNKEDAAKLSERLAKWAGSSELAQPGEYESVNEEEAVEEDAVEEVHEDVEEDTSLADMLKLAGRSGVIGLSQNNIIAESLELDEEDEVEEAEEVEEEAIDEAEVEETVEVPVSALSELIRLAGYEDYEAKIDEYENDPEEEYMDAEDQLVGLSGGLNGPKGMYPTAAGGDNAMAVSALKVKEDTLSFESFYKKYQEFVTEEK